MELIYLFLQLIFFLILSSINTHFFFSNNHQSYEINYYEKISFNLILQLNLVLFLSFLNINLTMIINLYLITCMFFLIINCKNFNKKFFKTDTFIMNSIFLTFVCSILFINIAFNLTLSWDTEKFWILKVLNFHNGNSIEDLANLYRSHYPFFGDLIWALFWKISLISEEYAGRLFFAFFYVISISTLIQNLKLTKIYKFIFITLIILSTYNYRELLSGNKEVIIFSLFCLLLSCIYQFNKKKCQFETYYLVFFIVTSNLIIWTKQEGFIYLITLILSILFFSNLHNKKKLIILLSAIGFYLLKFSIYNFYNFDLNLKSCCYYDFTPEGIFNKLSIERLLLVLKFLTYAFFHHALFLIGFVFTILSFFKKKLIKDFLYLYFLMLINFAFIIIIFMMTDADLELMLKTGIDRLAFMCLPIFIMLLIEYINYFSKKFK
jgi:hypothetical protein